MLAAAGGSLLSALQEVFPDQEPIDRTWINAWQDERVVDWVGQTGRKKIAIAAADRDLRRPPDQASAWPSHVRH